MAEGSKTYALDEYDLTVLFGETQGLTTESDTIVEGKLKIKAIKNTAWIQECDDKLYLVPLKVSHTFYSLCREIIRSSDKNAFAPLYLSEHSFDLRDKISQLQLLWRGDDNNEELTVNVDLAPSFKINDHILIAKKSRHLNDLEYDHKTGAIVNTNYFHVSDAEKQRRQIKKLPREAKQGLLIAKAARVASICHPGNLRGLGETDNISATSVITSYMLRSSLLSVPERRDLPMRTPYEFAQAIYERECMVYEPEVVTAIRKKICDYFKVNARKFRELSQELRDVKLASLNYGHNMSQMIRVYQRPEATKDRISRKGVPVYKCEKKDHSIDYGKMFNCKFNFIKHVIYMENFNDWCNFDLTSSGSDSDTDAKVEGPIALKEDVAQYTGIFRPVSKPKDVDCAIHVIPLSNEIVATHGRIINNFIKKI